MILNEPLQGKLVRMRSALVTDAEYTWDIRQDREKTKYLHFVGGNIDDQKKWIEEQQQREGDYFFVVSDEEDNLIGTFGVYEIVGRAGVVGRILLNGKPLQNMEAILLGYNFAFGICDLEYVHTDILENNSASMGIAIKLGAKEIKREFDDAFNDMMIHYIIERKCFYERKKILERFLYN